MKICTKCKKTKRLNQFHTDKRTKDNPKSTKRATQYLIKNKVTNDV